MPQANLTPVMRPYDPSTVPEPTPQQRERMARAREAVASGYASDGVRNVKPALAAAALAVGVAAPELLVPLGAALEETAAGAAIGAAGRAAAGAAGPAMRSAAGFLGQAARSFLDSSASAARSVAGAVTDPARLGEAAAEFVRSAFVEKAKDIVVIGAAGELVRRAGEAAHGWLAPEAHRQATAVEANRTTLAPVQDR
jgi:hypothetical protein